MNVSLTPKLERFVQEKVASGLYASASEVVREALRVLEERDRIEESRQQALRTRAAEASAISVPRTFLPDPAIEGASPHLLSSGRKGPRRAGA
ncbi:MAG: type II toxin-antitoxin system ParD family antitoxin [Candidatus Eisenbacteria bacterium]|nr:type II toxin-antitoxin system ParD family antitoxin [Candidatus Eisenbacteria bacterium]